MFLLHEYIPLFGVGTQKSLFALLSQWKCGKEKGILFEFVVVVQVISSDSGQEAITVLTQHMVYIICSYFVAVHESRFKYKNVDDINSSALAKKKNGKNQTA